MSMGYENNNYSRNNNYGGNKKDGPKEPTIYSEVRFSNPNSSVDPTTLKFQFTFGLLNIAIAPKKTTSTPNDETIKWDYDNSVGIWLSYNHAYILKTEIRRLLEMNDPKKLKCVGVPTKKDVIINFGFGTDFGTENFILSIAKLQSDGTIQTSYAYEFTDEPYTSIVNFDMNTKKFEKNRIPNVEIEMMLTLLDEYVKSANGAYAYMNRFYDRYENTKRYAMLSGICNKLGVPVGDKPNYSKGGGFFNSNSNNEMEGVMNPPTNDSFRQGSLSEMDEYNDDID